LAYYEKIGCQGGFILSKIATNTNNRFWSGVFTGVFGGCFLLTMIVLFLIKAYGLEVAINPEQLAGLIREKVKIEAKREILELTEGFKKELPVEISKHLNGLENFTISFGTSQVKLPEEMITSIKGEFNKIIEEAVFNALNDDNSRSYEERVGLDAYQLVTKILKQDLIGKTYLIKTSPWFSVPVKFIGASEPHLKIGI
jgi:hypothetical protein